MRMEVESGKLFIGGISWDTNEDRLKDYFQSFGEVVEAVIMKDRSTGRARGFGFVVFADPAVAERVVKENHMIDGRTVEAKKAVPRDDQYILHRNSSSPHHSLGPACTKKIFVGGLASTVTESDFRKYFDKFGTITDVVVMHDHNTKRPRGFGFITYDSEEAVHKVLVKTFHELNGKMVEVKRAVPKELSPVPAQSPLGGNNYGLSRVGSFLNAYDQGYNPNLMGGYAIMDGRFGPVAVCRSGYPPFSPSNYGVGPMLDLALGSNCGASGNFGSSLSSRHGLDPFYINPNTYDSPIRYGIGSVGTSSTLNSTSCSLWSSGNSNYNTNSGNSYEFFGSGSANSASLGAFGGAGGIWSSSVLSGHSGGKGSFSSAEFIDSNSAENSFTNRGGYDRNRGSNDSVTSSYDARNDADDGAFGNLYEGSSFYGEPTWRSLSPELEGSHSFGYSLGTTASDVTPSNSIGYVGGHNVTSRTKGGIAA